MKVKHTPWNVVNNNTGLHVDGASSLVVCHLDNCDKENSESNARLIAAAPDLMAVVKAYINAFERGEISNQKSNDADSTGLIANLAYAAIAKATGQDDGIRA